MVIRSSESRFGFPFTQVGGYQLSFWQRLNMKFVSVVVLIIALINTIEAGFYNRIRRQSTACLYTYLALSSDERDCLAHSDGFSIDQMERLCSSETCITAAKKLLHGCKVN